MKESTGEGCRGRTRLGTGVGVVITHGEHWSMSSAQIQIIDEVTLTTETVLYTPLVKPARSTVRTGQVETKSNLLQGLRGEESLATKSSLKQPFPFFHISIFAYHLNFHPIHAIMLYLLRFG